MNPKKRRKRLDEIGRKVDRCKDQPVTKEKIIELMNDAIWILDQLQEMHEESMAYLIEHNDKLKRIKKCK